GQVPNLDLSVEDRKLFARREIEESGGKAPTAAGEDVAIGRDRQAPGLLSPPRQVEDGPHLLRLQVPYADGNTRLSPRGDGDEGFAVRGEDGGGRPPVITRERAPHFARCHIDQADDIRSIDTRRIRRGQGFAVRGKEYPAHQAVMGPAHRSLFAEPPPRRREEEHDGAEHRREGQ